MLVSKNEMEELSVKIKELESDLFNMKVQLSNMEVEWYETIDELIIESEDNSSNKITMSCNLGAWEHVKDCNLDSEVLLFELENDKECTYMALSKSEIKKISEYLIQKLEYLG